MGNNQSSDSNDVEKNMEILPESSGGVQMKYDRPVALQRQEELQKLAHLYSRKKYLHKNRQDLENYDKVECIKENMVLLKQIFKQLDPTVMKCTNIEGDILLSMKYDSRHEILLIKVVKARELTPKDLRGSLADPYIKLKLHPDTHGQGIRETRVIKRSLYPIYHEIFSFNLPKDKLFSTKLVAQVWDHDILSNDDFIGECIVELRDHDFISNPMHTAWYPLQNETDLSVTGVLNISLSHRSPQTLLVNVHSAKGLAPKDENGKSAQPFVKVMIPGISTLYQTEIIKNTLNPVWDQTFEFQIPVEEFPYRYMVLNIVDNNTIGDNDSMGQVIIDLGNLDPEKGFEGEFELADLKNTDRLRTKWSQKAVAQEFKEALAAHSQFTKPGFMFDQPQSGNKVITLSCRKAGAMTRMTLQDGIPVK